MHTQYTTERFINAVLRYGPLDGQHITIPADETKARFYVGTEAHEYIRISHRAEFIHRDHAHRMLGGGA